MVAFAYHSVIMLAVINTAETEGIFPLKLIEQFSME